MSKPDLGWMFVNPTNGWLVPRTDAGPEAELAAKERERALNAGDVRPSYWTAEMEADLEARNGEADK